jgi:hypothetical protein
MDELHAVQGPEEDAPRVAPLAVATRPTGRGTPAADDGVQDEALHVLRQEAQRRGGNAAGNSTGPGTAPRQPGTGARWLITIATVAALAAVGVTVYAVLFRPAGPLERSVALPGRLGFLPAWAAVAVVLAALTAGTIALRALLRAVRDTAVEDVLTVVVAALVTVVALNGMWRFFANVLHFPPALRVLVFGVMEGGTIVCALRARRTIRDHAARIQAGDIDPDEPPSAGADGLMMWVFTGMSAVLSSLDAGSLAAAVARLAMPLLAAWLWDRSLRLEHRRVTGHKINWRVTPERVLVWARLAEPTSRSTVQVDVQRYLTRVTRARHSYRRLHVGEAPQWRVRYAYRVLEQRLQAAVDHTGLASSEDLQAELFRQIAARDGVRQLALASAPAPWAGRVDPQADGGGQLPPPPPPEGRGRRRRGRPPGGNAGTFAELVTQLADARLDGDHEQVHNLLAGRDDYAGFTQWLATSGQGTKRLMAVVSLYATSVPASNGTSPNWVATARNWIMSQVPGKPGEVDKKEIREEAAKLAPAWAAAATAGGPGAGPSQGEEPH